MPGESSAFIRAGSSKSAARTSTSAPTLPICAHIVRSRHVITARLRRRTCAFTASPVSRRSRSCKRWQEYRRMRKKMMMMMISSPLTLARVEEACLKKSACNLTSRQESSSVFKSSWSWLRGNRRTLKVQLSKQPSLRRPHKSTTRSCSLSQEKKINQRFKVRAAAGSSQ